MGGHVPPGVGTMVAAALAAQPQKVALVCVNVGPKYPMKYVEVLRDMCLRHLTESQHDFGFFCLTDRPDELPEGVNAIPAPEGLPGWWAKLALFSPDMPFADGQRVVYFDLDVAITGRLEDLVERDGIIADWGWRTYNSSVMSWTHGQHREAWDAFTPEVMTRPGQIVPLTNLPAGQVNGGDQEWLTEIGGWDVFPVEWCRSYRLEAQAWPPDECKVVVFHGRPKPDEITDGWVPNIWKVGGMTAIPIIQGVNTSEEDRLANVRSAVQRDLLWFTGFGDEGKSVAIVCGAPSMKDSLPEIRAQQRRGTRIVSVNAVWRFLVDNGITPDVNIMLDARPQMAAMTEGAPESMRWLLAGQCHPSVFDALEGRDVVLWHNGYGDNSAIREILDPWWEGANERPCILVPGGCTVGLRALWLATFSGFRTIHMYGIDGSYADDGAHHAYPQALNDQEATIQVQRGEKTYTCSLWMVRQASEFVQTWNDLRAFTDPASGRPAPVTIHVHGRGLLPDIARELRDEARAA